MQCETDKATIDYEVHGEGRPILFLHGWTMARRVEIVVYEKIFATRPGWRRIYPDLPGMGRSMAKAGSRTRTMCWRPCSPSSIACCRPARSCSPARRWRLSRARHRRAPPVADRRPAAARAVPSIADTARRTLPSVPAAGAGRRPDGDARTPRSGRPSRDVLVQKRDYIEAFKPKAAKRSSSRPSRPRRRSPSRSAPIPNATASPSIWPRWRRTSTSRP